MSHSLFSRLGIAIIGLTVAVVPSARAADDSLADARNLYAAAAYEDALAALNRLGPARPAGESRAIEQYRALCLLALGRSNEAEHAIEAVVTADPMFHPSETEVSPRVRAAFSDVRRRMLPAVAQQKYADAKAAFDRKQYAAASEGFGQVLELFADPDMAAAVSKPPLSDLRTLIVGFHDLSLQATAVAAPPPAPVVAAAPQPAPAPAVQAAAAAPKIYGAGDANVLAPVAVRQSLPPFRGAITRPMQGIIEVIIDEAGMVTDAIIRSSVSPLYDKVALGAAVNWRYQPATLNGAPVRYRKLIQINIAPGQ